MQAATRWAWLAERALEFEINHRVELVRMDYHTMPLGSERLVSDIDGAAVAAHGVPRALPGRAQHHRARVPPVAGLPRGVRRAHEPRRAGRVQRRRRGPAARRFTTTMDQYDEKVPGRYAFGRVFGVELEIQADVGTGLDHRVPGERPSRARRGRRAGAAVDLARARAPRRARRDGWTRVRRARTSTTRCRRGRGNDLKVDWDIALKRDDLFVDELVTWILGFVGSHDGVVRRAEDRAAARAGRGPRPPGGAAGRPGRGGAARRRAHGLGDTGAAVAAVNAYAAARGVTFRARRADLGALDALGKESRIDPAWYTASSSGRQIELARHADVGAAARELAPGGDVVVFKDLTPRYGDARPDWVEDYVDYTGHRDEVRAAREAPRRRLPHALDVSPGERRAGLQPVRVLRPAGDLRQLRHRTWTGR